MEKIYYVYVHYRGDTGQPFYVGKGKGKRVADRNSRNAHWRAVVSKHGYTHSLVAESLSETCANTLERIYIAKFRSMGVPLCNMTDGGDGVRGPQPKLRKAVMCSNGMRFDSISDAADHSSCTATKISAVCNGRRETAGGLTWWFEDDEPKVYSDPNGRMGRKKAIYRSDGMAFESLKMAALSVGGSSANVCKCASGEIESAYGYAWCYESVPVHPEPRYSRAAKSLGKPVMCDQTGVIYSTAEEAATSVRDTYPKASGWPVSRCARGLQKQAYGYTWSYAE